MTIHEALELHVDKPTKEEVWEEPPWTPEPPEWEQEISSEYSLGAEARKLWEEKLAEFAEVPPEKMTALFTGIGGGVADENKMGWVTVHGDGSEVPGYINLKEKLGHVPELLFLIASTRTTENLNGLVGVAREYKTQGVRGIIAVLTAFPHERQDHKFLGENGKIIQEVTTLKETIKTLAAPDYIKREDGYVYERPIDAALGLQLHSLRPVDLANMWEFPLIPLDLFDFLFFNADLDKIPREQLFIVGPDKGRKNIARRLASMMGIPYAEATKKRRREDDGYPELRLPQEALDYIKEHNCIVVTFDDEIREGGTMGELAELLADYAQELRIYVVKGIMASNREGTKTAIDHLLEHSLITQVMITDAVKPINSTEPIAAKLKQVSLALSIEGLIDYLKYNLIKQGDPEWLKLEETGILFRPDYSIEKYD